MEARRMDIRPVHAKVARPLKGSIEIKRAIKRPGAANAITCQYHRRTKPSDPRKPSRLTNSLITIAEISGPNIPSPRRPTDWSFVRSGSGAVNENPVSFGRT
ncbi:MAG: hypothetical protein ACRD8U_20935, partial [Pyrinomonadaceae bacterium]